MTKKPKRKPKVETGPVRPEELLVPSKLLKKLKPKKPRPKRPARKNQFHKPSTWKMIARLRDKWPIKFKCDVCGCTSTDAQKVCPECGAPSGAYAPAVALITERGKHHGDWLKQSHTAQSLKRVVRDAWNYQNGSLSDSHLDAIEMICVKLARILAGDPRHEDHWRDIQGYAELALR